MDPPSPTPGAVAQPTPTGANDIVPQAYDNTPSHHSAGRYSTSESFDSLKNLTVPPPPPPRIPNNDESGAGLSRADKEQDCDRRRPEEDDISRRITMSPQLIAQTVTPFLKDHIPGIYAPLAKPANSEVMQQNGDANSRYCYRHRPDSKCRRAADESKMVMIQSELDKLTSADQQAITHVWSLFSAAPAKHRDLMLRGIMTQCCFPQLSRVAREVADQLKIDFLTALPSELAYKILCYLDSSSLCKASQVSRQWRELADDDQVWHRLCEQHIDRKCTKCGFGLPLLERKRLRDWTRMQQLAKSREQSAPKPRIPAVAPTLPAPNTPKSPPTGQKREAAEISEAVDAKRRCVDGVANGEGSSGGVPLRTGHERKCRPWKAVYRDRFRVGYNWRYGRCSIKVFRGHTNGVTCLQIDDNMLDSGVMATGSYDATVRIWNLHTGEEIRTLGGHTGGIRALQFDEKILVSGSLDGTIKIWNWHTGDLLNTLACHQAGVISVNFDGEWLASGSIDKTVKVFNLKTRELFTLKGHGDWVNHVKIDGTESRTMFSASDDCKIKLWDLDSRKCIRTFEGHVGHVQQVLPLPPDFEPDDVPGFGRDNTDSTSVTSGRSSTPAVVAAPPYALPVIQRYPECTNAVASQPQVDDDPRAAYGPGFENDPDRPLPCRYILTAGLDSTIKCWDTATGRCIRTFFGHVEGVWAIVGDALRVISGANDAMVKVWDPRSGKCERTFTGHRGPVTCVGLSDSRMASGSEDCDVRLYSFQEAAGLEEFGTPS